MLTTIGSRPRTTRDVGAVIATEISQNGPCVRVSATAEAMAARATLFPETM